MLTTPSLSVYITQQRITTPKRKYMPKLDFATFFQRVTDSTDIRTQHDLANVLGVNRSAITQAKKRESIPLKWMLLLSREFGVNPDWLEFGRGSMRSGDGASQRADQHNEYEGPSVTVVPKVRARLCAGGGSWEVEATPVDEHVFREDWLARKGAAGQMVLMDVFGNSMEPEIREGDMVLVDQSQKDVLAGSIYAVGFEDTVMVKRVEHKPDGIHLLSDNPEYSPIALRGDELDSFRVIGRIVWVSREYR